MFYVNVASKRAHDSETGFPVWPASALYYPRAWCSEEFCVRLPRMRSWGAHGGEKRVHVLENRSPNNKTYYDIII